MSYVRPPFYESGNQSRPYRISAGDTVKLAVIHFPTDLYDASVIYEVWDVGGSQPPNRHERSVETFAFLSGQGVAYCDDTTVEVHAGGFLVLPPRSTHRIVNTGGERLYAITTMYPDDGFARLITSGEPTEFDDTDMEILWPDPKQPLER